jgi:hypothetical protein
MLRLLLRRPWCFIWIIPAIAGAACLLDVAAAFVNAWLNN